MTTTTETPVQTLAAPAASVASAEEVREAATRAERERISMIRAAVNGLDIPAETVDQWIADGKNVAECRAEIIESLKRKETPMNPRISVGEDLTRAAVFAGVESGHAVPHDRRQGRDVARPFAYASFLDMACASWRRPDATPPECRATRSPRSSCARTRRLTFRTSWPTSPTSACSASTRRTCRVMPVGRAARRTRRLQDHQRHAARQQPRAVAQVEGAEITHGTVSEKRE